MPSDTNETIRISEYDLKRLRKTNDAVGMWLERPWIGRQTAGLVEVNRLAQLVKYILEKYLDPLTNSQS